jgi:3-oxoacyl-[acyl-carrier protein] reductase
MVSSTTGLHGNVGQANYAAAKAAVVGLAKTIAQEWGPFGVRANIVAFGLVHTRCISAIPHVPYLAIDLSFV